MHAANTRRARSCVALDRPYRTVFGSTPLSLQKIMLVHPRSARGRSSTQIRPWDLWSTAHSPEGRWSPIGNLQSCSGRHRTESHGQAGRGGVLASYGVRPYHGGRLSAPAAELRPCAASSSQTSTCIRRCALPTRLYSVMYCPRSTTE